MILKKTRIAKIMALAMAFVLSLSFFLADATSVKQTAQASGMYTPTFRDVTGEVDTSALREASFNDSVLGAPKASSEDKWVIVGLSGESMLEGMEENGYGSLEEFSDSTVGKLTSEHISASQRSFLNRLTHDGIAYEYKYSYSALDNAVAIKVNSAHIERIEAMTAVDTVVVSNSYLSPQAVEGTSSDNATRNETFVYETGIYNSSEIISEYGYSGQGMVVAVLDTGLDYTHAAFQTPPADLSKLGLTEEDVKGFLNPANEEDTLMAVKRSAAKGETITYKDLYLSAKVPFAYDYADDDTDVYNTYSSHGTHVSGIVGGIDDHYTDKDGNYIDKQFIGVAPNAQIVSCKVFTDDLDDDLLGSAETYDILAALEDCVILGVDVINMSLGSSCGFSETQGDEEGDYIDRVYKSIQNAGISLVCAANNDYSSGYGSAFGTNLSSNPDSATVGAPATYGAALSVASINGKNSEYLVGNKSLSGSNGGVAVFYEEANDENGLPYDFAEGMLEIAKKLNTDDNPNNDVKDYTVGGTVATFEYVTVGGVGKAADYTGTVSRLLSDKDNPRIALISRGDSTFKEKVEIAMQMGAIGVIIYNNVAGKIRMSLGEIENPCPAVSINLDAGTSLVLGAGDTKDGSRYVGEITIDTSLSAGPFMSDFSSWGPAPDLKLKPEITAHGGEITSTVPGGYDEQSGTSMASPNMAGAMAIIRQYVKEEFNLGDSIEDKKQITKLCNQLAMSNTTIAYDPEGLPYSPRKQGSGLANLSNIVKSNAYISVEGQDKTKLEYGDDKNRTGEYSFEFTIFNKGKEGLTFTPEAMVMTETLSIDGLAVAEKAHLFEDCTVNYTVNGSALNAQTITVEAGSSAVIGATVILTEENKKYIEERFENGMFVEGYFRFISTDAAKQNDISIPFLAFYGDWSDGDLLDYSVYEIAEIEKDTSKTEEEKEKERVWATSAYTSYHQDYILPMGTYVYNLPDDVDPVYAEEEHAAVSRYEYYYGEHEGGNYRTSWEVRALYAGLLRNAKKVDYTLTNLDTGELLIEDSEHRISKAHSGGGGARPGFVELEIDPIEYGFTNNTQYQMSFDFDFEYDNGKGEVSTKTDNFTFSFYADYDAPLLTDTNIRYYYYKDGNKTKRKVFLDLDVYDNHYAQGIMLCYIDEDNYLTLINDYVIPVRQKSKNGTTTVSIEITDIYERFDGELYVQIDDFAMNYKVYGIDMRGNIANGMPTELSVDPAEQNVTVAINEMKKVTPVYNSDTDVADFEWTSADESIAIAKDGEIVGVSPGTTTVTVSTVLRLDGEGNPVGEALTATYNVTVTEQELVLSYPAMSFGLVRTDDKSYVKAEGLVEVNPAEEFKLLLEYDPWYYPTDRITIDWSSSNSNVASVDSEGNVKTYRKGTAIINAVINGTSYSTGVTLKVGEEFIVSNYRLIDYRGPGGVVYLPTDMNIFYIEDGAFEDNDNVTEVIINKTVMEIRENAFRNCTALERVSFVEREPMEVADADLSIIMDSAFASCPNLKEVDFSNTKTITVGRGVFTNCTSLTSLGTDKNGVSGASKLGTVSDNAFRGCTALKEIDISRFNKSGKNVFYGCTALSKVVTADFTAIGEKMFYGCTALEEIVVNTTKVGSEAFRGAGLKSVTFNANGVNIGDSAFASCAALTEVVYDCSVNSIGNRAFAGTALTEAVIPAGLTSIGAEVFSGAPVTKAVIASDCAIESIYTAGSPFAGVSISEYVVNSERYTSVDGVIYNSLKTELILAPANKESFDIPSSVTTIAANAFNGSVYVKGVRMGCVIFKNGIMTGSNISLIGEYAFANSSIEYADLMGIKISKGTFHSCKSLATVNIYSTNNEVIPESAFEGTEGLVTFDAAGTLPYTAIDSRAFYGSGIKSVDMLVVVIGDSAFEKSAIETAMFDGSAEIGVRAFSESALVSATFGAITNMGESAFENCTALTSVTFGNGTTVIGDNAFAQSESNEALVTVNVPDTVKTVGNFAFYNCAGLTSFVSDGVVTVGDFAFTNATSLASFSFESVETVGDYAFSGYTVMELKDYFERVFIFETADTSTATKLTNLVLPKATVIGKCAFAGVKAGKIETPVAEVIGDQAFYYATATTYNVPASVKSMGKGALVLINATSFTSDNDKYVSEDGVIYRVLGEDKYELFAYPSLRKGEKKAGSLSYFIYTIKEGTVRISEYAGCIMANVNEVILPYTVKSVGSFAFFNSAIETYAFESVNAPVLESVPTDDIYTYLSGFFGNMRVAFYSNFSTYYCYIFPYYFSGIARDEMDEIEQYLGVSLSFDYKYPSNGVGYTEYVYASYFEKATVTAPVIDDYTRVAKSKIDALHTADEIQSWLNLPVNEDNKQMVVDFGNAVIEARSYFNNVADPVQQSFLTEGSGEKLSALEGSLRAIKAHFGIPVNIKNLNYENGYKKEYYAGELFDLSTLVLVIEYDDGSSEVTDSSGLTLTTGPLGIYDRSVTVTGTFDGQQHTLRIPVTVTENPNPPVGPGDSSSDSTSDSTSAGESTGGDSTSVGGGDEKGCTGAIIGIVAGVAAVAAVAAVFFILKRRK